MERATILRTSNWVHEYVGTEFPGENAVFISFTTQFFAMPNSPSAEKSLRRSEARRDRNRKQRGSLRTRLKKFRAYLGEKPTLEEADKQFSLVVKALDQAASKKLIHKIAASRTKSRLAALKRKTFVG